MLILYKEASTGRCSVGVIGLPAKDGLDSQLRINHFGPFLLTKLLLPKLAQNARIVNVSSRAHKQGSLKIEGNKLVGTPSHWYMLEWGSALGLILNKAAAAQTCPDRPSSQCCIQATSRATSNMTEAVVVKPSLNQISSTVPVLVRLPGHADVHAFAWLQVTPIPPKALGTWALWPAQGRGACRASQHSPLQLQALPPSLQQLSDRMFYMCRLTCRPIKTPPSVQVHAVRKVETVQRAPCAGAAPAAVGR